jgi:hypothetical protein
MQGLLTSVVLSASPIFVGATRKRGKCKKYPTPFVETGLRRRKRSCVRQPGFRPRTSRAHSIAHDEPPSALVKIVELQDEDKEQAEDHCHDSRKEIIPETPVPLMQRVGEELGIEPIKISEEKLRVTPKSKKNKKVPNDK